MEEVKLKTLENIQGDIDIKVRQGSINFLEYEKLKNEALMLADFINTIEVSEDNVKETKKMLAKVNKSISKLNSERIRIKKHILEPYQEFETKVKEIEKIVKDADTVVRNQVRQLEEEERERKRKEIENIWNLRIEQYQLSKIISFDSWLENRHLNKSVSINKVESEMVEFLEKSEKDIEIISKMEYGQEIIQEYLNNFYMAGAIEIVQDRHRAIEEQKKLFEKEEVDIKKKYAFIIDNEKDKKMLEMLLNEYEIKFELKEI